MADGGDRPSGRIRPADADQIMVASLVSICCRLFDDADLETALHLLGRALPLTGSSSRIAALKPVAGDILASAARRRRVDGSVAWARANMDLRRALAADALRQALSRVEM